MGLFFGQPDVIASGANATLDTSETDILVVTDRKYHSYSQLSMYASVELGSHDAIELRVYYQGENGEWLPILKHTISTGLVEEFLYRFEADFGGVLDLPQSATFGFKVTAAGVGGASSDGSATIKILGRNN